MKHKNQLCVYRYVFCICRLCLFVFVVSSIVVFSCNILMSYYIVYVIRFGQRWDRLGWLVVWKSFSMCVCVSLEDPLENEMFHLKGLSSNKMMMKPRMLLTTICCSHMQLLYFFTVNFTLYYKKPRRGGFFMIFQEAVERQDSES